MYISGETVKRALVDLKGTANSLLKIWLTLKAMGLEADSPVLVDTANSTNALKSLFKSGAHDGSFFIPFASTMSELWMKSHASRSIIQTNIKKWHDGTVTSVDPSAFLKISKHGTKYKVAFSSTYPTGLGVGPNGFANDAEHPLAVPMRQFAVWVFCRDEIPNTVTDVGQYLCEKLRALLHLEADEEHCVFSDVAFEITQSPECLSEGNLFDLCHGRPIQKVSKEMSRQLIRYGAPGTGKSFGLDGDTGDAVVFRTTFHPDSDYSTFVGAYKPTMKGEGADERISYSFRPQAFMNAYVAAWKSWANAGDGVADSQKPVVLVIEEINRGNCAQIFGDLFQLLDRDEDGYSMYPIDADADLAKWLAADEQFGLLRASGADEVRALPAVAEDVFAGRKLMLPPNLYIWATMNTSDQSLFPIDSAFKRRWDWQYVPIAKPEKANDPNWKERKIVANGVKYDWWSFISIINAHIADVTKSEDKQLGYFFVKAPDATGVITAERFANKVLFYLFNDVFKDWDLPAKIFGNPSGSKYVFKDFFYDATTTIGEKTFKPGDVREEIVAEFIERQEHDGEKVAKE